MVATLKIPMERRRGQTNRQDRESADLGSDLTERSTSIGRVAAAAAGWLSDVLWSRSRHIRSAIPKCAMHMLHAGIPAEGPAESDGQVHQLNGRSTPKVFALDVAARHRVQFAMPEADAVALIKQLERLKAVSAGSVKGSWCICIYGKIEHQTHRGYCPSGQNSLYILWRWPTYSNLARWETLLVPSCRAICRNASSPVRSLRTVTWLRRGLPDSINTIFQHDSSNKIDCSYHAVAIRPSAPFMLCYLAILRQSCFICR